MSDTRPLTWLPENAESPQGFAGIVVAEAISEPDQPSVADALVLISEALEHVAREIGYLTNGGFSVTVRLEK